MTWEADRRASEHPGQVGRAMSVGISRFTGLRRIQGSPLSCHGIEARRSLAREQMELPHLPADLPYRSLGASIKRPLPLHRLLPRTAKHPTNLSLSRSPQLRLLHRTSEPEKKGERP